MVFLKKNRPKWSLLEEETLELGCDRVTAMPTSVWDTRSAEAGPVPHSLHIFSIHKSVIPLLDPSLTWSAIVNDLV